jgi:hypothetical protein
MGSLRAEPIHVRLFGNPQSQSFKFAGTMTHHDSTSVAHASDDVTR